VLGRLRNTDVGQLPIALSIIVLVAVCNLLYVGFACPFDLAPDEAHYWDWSRNLDWCFYSKGPLVAVLIHLGCALFGDTPFGVRFPAILCGMLLHLAIWLLALRTSNSPRFALIVLLCALTLPGLSAVSLIMTIDAPFLCLWAWSAVFVHRAVFGGHAWNWLAAGACVALGHLTKQSMVLFPLSITLWFLFQPSHRDQLRKSGFWLFLVFGSLGLLPMILWNFQHEWIGFRHLLGMSGVGQKSFRWFGPLAFAGEQLGFLLVFWFIAWITGIVQAIQQKCPQQMFLVYLSLPIWIVCALASFGNAGQPNWPAAAYISGFVLAVQAIQRGASAIISPVWLNRTFAAAIICGISISIVLRWPGMLRPIAAELVAAPTRDVPCPVRKLDPTARLLGWRTLAKEVDAVRARVRSETGTDPLIATMTWTVPGELGFYCDGHPQVYSFGFALADRMSQYDVWRPNPVHDAQAFAGRTFVYVGFKLPRSAFDRVKRVAEVVHRENGVPVAAWEIWVCEGFRGFQQEAEHGTPARY